MGAKKVFFWTGTILTTTVGASIPIAMGILNQLNYKMNAPRDDRIDMSNSETWTINTIDDIDIELNGEYDILTINDISNQILTNSKIVSFVKNTFFNNTGLDILPNDVVLSTDVTKSKIKKGEFLTIFVTAGSSSLVVTGQYQFKVKAHFKAISVFNLNELGSINFSKMLHFYSQKPECIDVDDIFSYTNFEKTDIMLELRYAIIDKIYSQKHIQIKASDISVEIKTNDIFDLNFSKERFLAIVVSPSLTAEKIIGETTVPIKAKAEYDNKNYLPNISVLANRNIGNYSFFAWTSKKITNEEFSNNIRDCKKNGLQDTILETIKNEINPLTELNDIYSITLLKTPSEIGYDFLKGKTIQFLVKANDFIPSPKITGEVLITYDFVARTFNVDVESQFNACGTADAYDPKNENKKPEDYFLGFKEQAIFEDASLGGCYGKWEMAIKSFSIYFSYNALVLDKLESGKKYTIFELDSLGVFKDTDIPIPYMKLTNGSYISCGRNDYIGTDWPIASWFDNDIKQIKILDDGQPRYFNEDERVGKDWIVDGSGNWDFHVRMKNFWNSICFEKKVNFDEDFKEVLVATTVSNSKITWDWRNDKKSCTAEPKWYKDNVTFIEKEE